jgi:glycosyltransferase involved in cell wall biosynthesis
VKILLVHNFYGSTAPSGENTAFLAEASLLRSHGHAVYEFTRTSDEILDKGRPGALKGAFSSVWNPFSLRLLKRAIQDANPDVVHVHNTFPLLSPSVFYASREQRVPTVMTMHNYRIGCSAATALRRDQPCMLCLDRRSVLPALRYGCYRNSRVATFPVSMMIALHNAKKTWSRNVDAFITLTDFQREKMSLFGVPADSLFVKPHFMADPPQPVPWNSREEKAVFVGRLYAAKGIHILIEAWKQWGKNAPRLEIIGDGPMKEELVRSLEQSEAAASVSFTGNMTRREAMSRLSRAKLLIIPSLCYEGFPMVVQEAFALGVPVAASNIGSLPYLVRENSNGALFPAGSASDIRKCVGPLLADNESLSALGKGARREFDEKFTAEKNHELLMGIYKAAADHRSARAH